MIESLFKKLIIDGIRDSFIVWKDEFHNVITDAGVVIFFIVAPLFYPLLYAFIYDSEAITKVPIVVVDQSNTPRSREFARLCGAGKELCVVGKAADMEEAKRCLHEKKAYGIMMIPSDFNKKIVRHEQSYVILYSDMSSLLYYKAFLSTLTDVSLEMGHDIQVQRLLGKTAREQSVETMPVVYDHITYFNPKSGFASFLIPAVLMLIIQQMMLMGISLLCGAARDRNSFRDLIPMQRHYRGTFRIVFGKSLCYMMIFAVVSFYLLWVVPRIFDLPQMGNRALTAMFILPYLLACVFFSLTFTAFVRDREASFIIFIFLSLILLFASGISWPAASVPWYWKAFSYFFPSTFGIQGFVKMNTMGATLHNVSFEYVALWIQTVIYFITASLVYRWQILRSERNHLRNLNKTQ